MHEELCELINYVGIVTSCLTCCNYYFMFKFNATINYMYIIPHILQQFPVVILMNNPLMITH